MDIVLNQKDADFILKYIRGELERLIISEKTHEEKYKKLQNHYKKMKKDTFVDGLMDIAGELHSDVSEGLNEYHKGLERCIELLMCGSEVSNENS